MTIKDANAAVEMSTTSITEPRERMTTLKAQSIEQNDIFFESGVLFCRLFFGAFGIFSLLFILISATAYEIAAEAFAAAVCA